MTTMTTKHIEVVSLLTTDVLIPNVDGSLDLNVYKTMAKFVAMASIISQEDKECKRIKFESELFCLDDPNKNIHEDWKKFHRDVSERASVLSEYNDAPIKIK